MTYRMLKVKVSLYLLRATDSCFMASVASHSSPPLFQVQSIKQNNSSLKQSLNAGVDVFRAAEVNLFLHSCLSSFSSLYIPHLSLLCFLFPDSNDFTLSCSSVHSALPQFPPDIISPLAGLRLVLICSLLSRCYFHLFLLLVLTTYCTPVML